LKDPSRKGAETNERSEIDETLERNSADFVATICNVLLQRTRARDPASQKFARPFREVRLTLFIIRKPRMLVLEKRSFWVAQHPAPGDLSLPSRRGTRARISENICERICFAERRGIDRAGIGHSRDAWRAIIYSLDVKRVAFNERVSSFAARFKQQRRVQRLQ